MKAIKTIAMALMLLAAVPAVAQKDVAFMRRVADNAVFSKNIVASADFTFSMGGTDMTLDGSLHMRRDEVIRIQVTPMGLMEVARLEFTPEGVLLIDRMHKQYVRASYSEVSFLRNHGLSFHTLQALLWNQLFKPGCERVGELDYEDFAVTASEDGATRRIALDDRDIAYSWTADDAAALIRRTDVSCGGISVSCTYDRFADVGSRKFPRSIVLEGEGSVGGRQRKASIGLSLGTVTDNSDWDTQTTVSSRYTQVTPEEFMKNIMKM